MTRTDPTMFLAVADLAGKPLGVPYFAALNVTRSLVVRLRQLARLCDTHGIAWLVARESEPRAYWHVGDELMTEQTTLYHVVGSCIYLELSARRRVSGGYGEMEAIGQTPVVDVAELVHMRRQRILFDFRAHDGQDEGDGEPFALEVMRQLSLARAAPSCAPKPGD